MVKYAREKEPKLSKSRSAKRSKARTAKMAMTMPRMKKALATVTYYIILYDILYYII